MLLGSLGVEGLWLGSVIYITLRRTEKDSHRTGINNSSSAREIVESWGDGVFRYNGCYYNLYAVVPPRTGLENGLK